MPDLDSSTTPIRTERLTLRPPEASDAAAVAALVGDIRVARWLTRVPHPYSEADALDFADRLGGPEARTFLVFREDRLVGCAGLEAELGYWIGRAHWGRGYATEAARALLERHFATSDDPVRSGYFLGNAASANVLTKLGFRPTHVEDVTTVRGDAVRVQKMRLGPEDRA